MYRNKARLQPCIESKARVFSKEPLNGLFLRVNHISALYTGVAHTSVLDVKFRQHLEFNCRNEMALSLRHDQCILHTERSHNSYSFDPFLDWLGSKLAI